MSVELTLDVYSGRENPKCKLNDAEVQELGQQLRQIQNSKTNRLPNPPALGYRGLHLHATEKGLPSRMTVFDGIVQTESGNFQDSERKIEKWLVQKCRHVVDEPTYSYLQSALKAH